MSSNLFSKGDFVHVSGLTSEAGKKLNNSIGIILGSGSARAVANDPNNNEDVVMIHRYPVRIWAVQMEAASVDPSEKAPFFIKCADAFLDKKLKEDNLEACIPPMEPNGALHNAAQYFAGKAFNDGDNKGGLFWAEYWYNIEPVKMEELVGMYVSALVEDGQVKKASSVLWEHQKAAVVNDAHGPNFGLELLYLMVAVFSKAGEHLEEAMDYALMISPETEDGNAKRECAFLGLMNCCTKMLFNDKLGNNTDPIVPQVYLRASKHALAMNPMKADRHMSVGSAYHFSENYIMAAKYYRRALTLLLDNPSQEACGNPTPEKIKEMIVLNQLMCPGMPLDGYFCVDLETYIRKDERHLVMYAQGGRFLTHRPDIFRRYPLPADPDDETIFPASFLEQVQWTEEE